MPDITIIVLVAVFIAVATAAGAVTSTILSSASTERKRLRSVTRVSSSLALPELSPLAKDRRQSADGWYKRAAALLPSGEKNQDRLRMQLISAGFHHPAAPVIFRFFERVMPFLLAPIPLFFLAGQRAYFAVALVAAASFFGPGLYIGQRLAKRRREIENGLPDALDLLVVCIEAGSGLDQAIVKCADELVIAYPTLANELRILTAEIRAGKPRLDAFKSLAKRTKVDDVRGLVAMLIQTDKFGTSIGQALRTHADVSRSKRRQRAEEKAQKVGVKLVFPLVLCFFPAFYVVVLGPAVIQFINQFMK
jgi:tight adherence protein C